MYRLIALVLVSFLFVACGSSSGGSSGSGSGSQIDNCESNVNNQFVGCWYSETCAQSVTQPAVYQQSILNFHNDGSLNQGMNFYDNANCSGTPIVTDAAPTHSYSILSSVMSSGGLTVNGLLLNRSGAIVYTAYYITVDTRLCFNNGDFEVNGAGGGLIAINPNELSGAQITINSATSACSIK